MMGAEQNKPSIVAKLMGLDEVPPLQQPVYRQQRVLSEDYLQKSSSISSKEKRSSKTRPKRRPVQKKASSSSSKDGSPACRGQRSHLFDGMQCLKSTMVDSQKSGQNGRLDKGIEERNDFSESTNSATKIVVLRPNLGSVNHASKPSFLLDSRTTFAWEFKKQLLERSKMMKSCQEVRSGSRGCNLGHAMPGPESKRRLSLRTQVVIGGKDESVSKRISFSSNPVTKFNRLSEIDVKSSSGNRGNNTLTSLKNLLFTCGDVRTKQMSEQIACNDSAKERCALCSSDVSFEQDSAHEDGFMYSNCIQIDDELSKSTGETYQSSPSSVLEPPFKEGNSSSSEYSKSVSTDLHGLWMKLQILKSESEENNLKRETIASSGGDAPERSFYTGQNTKPIRCFGPKESREFSYLVDMLDESGFQGGNVAVSPERWHSLECMMNPFLFETLEMKYGAQPTWDKADRQLLFDRINSGVSEIFQPRVDSLVGPNPLTRRMSAMLKRDIVEEQLWKLLVSQEKEVDKDLSEKAVGRQPWLVLADEVDSIVGEIEAFLFDELTAEFIV